jgi:hypothetical protein
MKLGELTGIHVFGADGYVCMGQQVVNPRTLFFSLPYIQWYATNCYMQEAMTGSAPKPIQVYHQGYKGSDP